MSIELRKRRTIIGTVVIAVFFGLLVLSLVKTQLVNGDEYKAAAKSLAITTGTVKAPRGEILDCNGKPLVTNRQGNSIIFKHSSFPEAKKQEERNKLIHSLINTFEKNSVEWIDRLPIIYDEHGKLIVDEEKQKEFEYMVSEEMLELPGGVETSPDACLSALIQRYKLYDYSVQDARKIASVCFGMKYLSFSSVNDYTFAEDVPSSVVATIKEMSNTYPGVDVATVTYREYINKTSFSHILGVVGSISAEEYEKEKVKLDEKLNDESLTATDVTVLKTNAYSLNDNYGKSGIEAAMENYLRGKNGIKTTTKEADGTISESYITKPQQGAAVVTTINADLQRVAAKSLAKMLKGNRNLSYFSDAGAVVVLDCNTGAVLAAVSLPTYDITKYFEDYSKLASDDASPLWNRSFQSTYAPGSTMKPAIALASLEEGAINQTSSVYCGKDYVVKDQTFSCLKTHGYINVTTALQKSCNVFFYNMGARLGIDKMNKYCNLLGLGQKTGIELPEAEGMLASIANKEARGQTWLPGDTIQAAIGQSDNIFTPLQLANYAATLGNGGTRYKPYIIKSVLSSDMTEVIYETEPTVLNTLNVKKENLDIVNKGMREVVSLGACRKYFANCPVDAAGKTGTSQLKRTTKSGRVMDCNNGFFISFAPYENPELAVAVVAENALSGARASAVAADVYKYYFGQRTKVDKQDVPNSLIG